MFFLLASPILVKNKFYEKNLNQKLGPTWDTLVDPFYYLGPLRPSSSDIYDFETTENESSKNWKLSSRCGTEGRLSQRDDVACPNVIIINTDDMSWADLTLNNPSKLIPTPNIDRLASKGINFRDGHSCTARCAPSRFEFFTTGLRFNRNGHLR